MHALILVLIAFCVAVAWLVLLVATGFSILAVSAGLLASIYALGLS